jgi:hypothetical protein
MAQVAPLGHEPAHTPPQPLGIPQPTPGGQLGTHTQRPAVQVSLVFMHGPLQTPPQPSGAPHAPPAGQVGVQTAAQRPALQRWPEGQVPAQRPPQPSGAPQAAPAGQEGTQHVPALQV